jgi:hypothetical protein
MDSDSDAILREPPVAGDELDTLLGALERQRRFVAWKCGDLNSAGLRATLGPSTMTLGGLRKHLALAADAMSAVTLQGRARDQPWDAVEWGADRTGVADRGRDSPSSSGRSGGRRWTGPAPGSPAPAPAGLGLASYTSRDGRHPSVRRLRMDMIEECARHVGHADLIRESVDGLVGEDPE